MNYVCFGNKANFAVLDKVNKKYVCVKDGMLYDNTDKAEKMYKKYYADIKNGKIPDTKMGVLFYEHLQGNRELKDCMIYDSDIIFQTDDRIALDKFIIQSQIEQLDSKRRYLDSCISKTEKAVGLYTYGGK